MLIEFKVANFRSIREEQTLSLVASNYEKGCDECLIAPDLPGLAGVKLLKGAAIYGANASGKSNILKALQFVANFVANSLTKLKPGDPTGVQPFKLDRESIDKPSRFELTFVANDVRYIFALSVTRQRVVEERLEAYPKGLRQLWYQRTYDSKKEAYQWAKASTHFKRDPSLQERTRENALFLSVGPQFNHPQLTPIFNWFLGQMDFVNLSLDEGVASAFSTYMLQIPSYRERVVEFLRKADLGILDVIATFEDVEPDWFKNSGALREGKIVDDDSGIPPFKRTRLNLLHKGVDGAETLLDFEDEESAGTRLFFSLIAYWLDAMEEGKLLIVDEIDTSLHNLLVRELLRLILRDESYNVGAQIVFTTNNSVLLDDSFLRRDQIWFTEKSTSGATTLYPLTDYKPRKEEALARGYLAGRYGAIPFLPEGLNT